MLQKIGTLKFNNGQGEVVLQNNDGKSYQVNTVMAFIWEKFDGKTTIQSIQEDLSELMDVDPQDSMELIDFAVKELSKISLIRQSNNQIAS